jgi:hypothetical protein
LMITIAKVMADNKLDAIVHKSVEHERSLIKDGINPPYVTTRGVPTLNTFLIYAGSVTVPAGFTSNNLPVGITFFGLPYSEPVLLKLAYSYEQATHHRVPPKTTPARSYAIARYERMRELAVWLDADDVEPGTLLPKLKELSDVAAEVVGFAGENRLRAERHCGQILGELQAKSDALGITLNHLIRAASDLCAEREAASAE